MIQEHFRVHKMKHKTTKTSFLFFSSIFFFFTIFFLPFLSPITIQENTQFQPTGTNTTFIMGNNLTFDLVEVHSTYLKLDNNTISVNSSVGSVNITIFNFTDSYKKWNETKSDSSATVSYVVSNFSSGVSVLATKNSVEWQAVTSNSTGYISFSYSGSSALFELELGVMPSTTETPTTSSPGGGYPIYKPTQEQLKKGYEKILRKNYKIEFEFNNKTHELKLNEIIDDKTIQITVSSEPQIFDLSVNETKKLNLDEDGFYDLEIFLKSISGFSYWKKADLVVKFMQEEIPFEEKPVTEDVGEEEIEERNLTWLWIVISLIIILVIVVSVGWKKKIEKI